MAVSLTFMVIDSGHKTVLLVQQHSIFLYDLENMIKARLEKLICVGALHNETANFWPPTCLQFEDKLAVL